MAKAKGIAVEILERINQSLFALPVKPAKGQTEAAEFLAPAFKFALKRGYSLDEIQSHINKEFGLTLQMSKMKKAIIPSENASADGTADNPKKEKRQKQTDTPPATTNNENGSEDADTPTANAGWEKPETRTGETSATLKKPPVKWGGFEIVPDTPIGEL